MRRLQTIFLLFALLSAPAFTKNFSKDDCRLASTFTGLYTDAQALVIPTVTTLDSNIQAYNDGNQELCFCWGKTAAAQCTSDNICLPPGATFERNGIDVRNFVRIKHDGVAATVGKVCVGVW